MLCRRTPLPGTSEQTECIMGVFVVFTIRQSGDWQLSVDVFVLIKFVLVVGVDVTRTHTHTQSVSLEWETRSGLDHKSRSTTSSQRSTTSS